MKILKWIAAFAVVMAVLLAGIFMFTGGMVKDTKDFFIALKNNDTAKAASYLSKTFTDSTSVEELKDFFDNSSLADYKDSSWGSRNITNDTAVIKGSVITESGQKIPLSVSFVKELGKWKILTIDIRKVGLNSKINIPSPNEQVELVNEAMTVFSSSLEAGSMAGFYSFLSKLLQKQKTLEEFEKIFASYYPDAPDFRYTTTKSSPVFKQAAFVNEFNELVIEGYYPSGKVNLEFDQKYIREGSAWKLNGFFIEIVDAESYAIPTKEEQLKLVNDSMAAFVQSLKNKSMQNFYDHVSVLWRNDQDLATFENNFSGIYDRAEDFENMVTGSSPIFEPEAFIDDERILEIKAYYPAGDLKLSFEQSYALEALDWKLIGFRFKVE